MEYWSNGVMEYWTKAAIQTYPHSGTVITPTLHYSTTPHTRPENRRSLELLAIFMGTSWLVFLIGTGGILVDETVFFLAKDGLKGTTAARAVSPFVLRPVGVSAV
jgi:hypothetical protein